MKLNKYKLLPAAALFSAFFAGHVQAGPIAVYNGPAISKTFPACASFGDFISCSLPFLNELAGKAQGTTTDKGGYVISTPQGALKDYLVVQAGGAAALDNSDTTPSPSQVENGFKSNSGGVNFLATGRATGSVMFAGNMANPDNNALSSAQDNIGTWDVSTTWLKDALTTADGKRHELMIGFDYNQDQAATTSMDIWGLVTVRKSGGGLPDINFEFNGDTQGYASFNSTKGFFDKPSAADFDTVSGTICIYDNSPIPVPYPGGKCPSSNPDPAHLGGNLTTEIDNSQATNSTEFLAFLPELNSNLETYVKQGYDTISVRLLMGCFGGTDKKNGQDYLSAGETKNCDTGGFGDVYLMAGAAMNETPEPSSIVLAGLGLLGISRVRRARQS